MINKNRIIRTGLLLTVIFLIHYKAVAQLQVGFTPRFSDGVYGDFLTIGNNMLSTTSTGNYTGSDGNHNLTTVFVDIDADATTFNSSSANLTGPLAGTNCVAIKKAYLYWAAADLEESNIANEPNWNYNDIKIMLPGSATYTTLTADNVIYRGRAAHFVNDPYACFKDITALVQALASPFGKYQMANVRAKKGTLNPDHTGGNVGTSGGWQIVFVYEGTETDPQGNSVLPAKYITLFDGYANVTSAQNNYNITISGFQTPPVGSVQTKILFGSLEGDRDLTGDQFQIRNVANTFVDLTTGSFRPTNNFFSSRVTVGNADFTDRNPASTNTLGYDIGYFTLNNPSNSIITNNQSSAVFRLTSNQETYGLYLIGFSTDVWAPDLSPLLQTSTPGTVNPGDTISYTFTVKNNGNDNAQNIVITRTLPAEVELVQPVTPLPAGVTYSYVAGTRVLSFFIQNGFADVGDPAINISYKTVVKDQCYFLETACVPSTTAQLLATYTGTQNPATQTTLSSNGITGCGLGNDKSNTTFINQPSAATWATLAGALDRTVNCDDAQALAASQTLFPATNKCNFTLNKISGSFVPNTCPIKGKYTNTWTFTDKCGRTSPLFTQVITVQDTTKPVITSTPQNITVSCASDVQQASTSSISATDNCAGTVTKTVADVITNQSCANRYTLTRTWTATDVCGNSSTSSQTITVNDLTPPVITGTPQNITVSCASDVPQASNTSISATDNCTGTVTKSVADVITNQTCANKYTVTRTWTATDVCGNSSTSSQTVTVNDTIKPFITGTPQNITVSCESDVPQASTSSVSASDNCAGTVTKIVNDVITNQSCTNRFTVTRMWTATDVCGNSSTSSQTITVDDTIKPVFVETLPRDITVDCNAIPTAAILTATDNCGQASVTFNESTTQGGCSGSGGIIRTWTATDVCNNITVHVQNITIQDTTKPIITGTPQNITVGCSSDVPQASTANISATDNCTGTVTKTVDDAISNQVCSNQYTITRTWTATDACSNSSTSSQTITVNDLTPPVITGTPQNITVSCASDVPQASTASVSATDNCTGTVTKTVADIITNQTCANKYTVTRTWTATDVCGNSSTSSQTITVNDLTPPVITGTPQNITVSCASDVPQASNTSISATDNCTGTVTKSVADVITPGSCANKYTVTRTWTATDVCGNSSTSSQTITVNDLTPPVIAGTPQNITVSCASDVPQASNTSISATDNCTGTVTKSVADVITPGSCANKYTVTRTWTATDVCGNSSTSSQTITVNDLTPPVIAGTPQNITVSCASDVPQASNTSISATDNCAGTVTKTVADVITNQTCANKYTVTRTWTATDVCGNSSTSSQTIIVNDQTPPVIAGTPQNITVSCASDVPQASTASVSVTDNCAGTVTKTVADVITNQSCANKYTVTRTWTATDVCGNSSTSSQMITVNDLTPPVIAGTPQNITVSCSSDVPQGSITSVSTTDNCAGTVTKTVDDVITNQSCANRYTVTRTWTATDVCGNSSTSSQTITVNDTIKPVFVEILPIDIIVDCNAIPTAGILTATDNCGQASVTFNESTTQGGCSGSGGIIRTWTAKDVCNNITVHVQNITIQDTTKPVITGTPQNITVGCSSDVPQASTANISATDNCTGTVTKTVDDAISNQVCSNQYTITRTWTATDACSNSSTSTQMITVNDTIKPVITGTPQNVTVSCASDVSQASIVSVSATDNCAGTVTKTVDDVISNQTCLNKYIVTRTWTATDVCGNSSTSQQTITVNDTIKPVITGTPQNVTVSCASDVPQASSSSVSTTDNCAGQVVVTVNDITTTGSCANKYTITRTWTATDVCGNSSSSQQTITVNDTIKPVILEAPRNITVSCAADVPQASISSVVVTDNCVGEITVLVSDVITNQTCSNKYLITRKWTATDVCGNSSISSQTISVNDQTSPVITGTPQNVSVSCTSDVPQASITRVNATDNCVGTVIVTVNDLIKDQICANKYTIARTWTATDVCGNSSISSQTITVDDQTSPVITGTPQNIIVSCASDVPLASITSVSATDNCLGEVTVTVNDIITLVSCVNKYTVTRTWTATDVCGNSSTSSQIITVNDTIKPTFKEPLPSDQFVCSEVPNAPILTATDNCGSAPVSFSELIDSVSTPNIKIYTRIWTATDLCQNITTHIQTIIVSSVIRRTISREVCEGELVTLGNNSYGLSGTYSVVFESTIGCDSIVTLNLTVNPVKYTNIDAVLCLGEQIQIGEYIFTTSITNEIIVLETSKGCDSIITLNLVVLNSDTIVTNRVICQGNRVDIGGNLFSTSGTYFIPFQNHQCTGIVQLNLTVLQPTSSTINHSVCEGEVLTVAGHVFSESGTYTITIPNAMGCDSIISLNLDVRQKTSSILNRMICYGESITVGNQLFNTSGTYNLILPNANGCDSIVTINLQVLSNADTTQINRTICEGESTIVSEQQFDEEGVYYITINNGRCNSIVELTLTVNPVSAITIERFICDGEAIVVGNQTFTKDGIYTIVLQNSTGCDSIVTLNLNVSEGANKTQLDTAICFGESLTYQGQTFSTTGTYQVIYPVDQCRDTLLLNLLVNPLSASRIDTTVFDCHGGVTVGGQVFIEPGTYHIPLQNSFGCDSIITLNLRIRICDTIPIGQDITIYDTLPVQTTINICDLSLPPGNNVVVESCQGNTSGTAPHGTWTINQQTKCIVFTAGQIIGNDTLCISACDTVTRQCNITTVIITVTGLPPNAVDDCVEETEQNTEIIIAVLENDTDPDLDNLFIESIVSQPKHGTTTIEQTGQTIIYTPNKNFCGRDTFYYEVCDREDGCDTAMVCLEIKCECILPQVITPNNDGFNDHLFFPCLGIIEGARLLVWHRWGLIVYEDNNYKNDWNGTLKGELLPAGTYWYSIEYKDVESQQVVKAVNYFMIIN